MTAIISFIAACALVALPALAQSGSDLKIGYVGPLSGFASQYGSAVLDGVRLAVEEVNSGGASVVLVAEDDQSLPRNILGAYQKLRNVERIDALVAGSWWANAIVKSVERDGIPFLSCETLFNKEFVLAPNYFSLLGDLRDWVRIFEPLVAQHGWKRAVMIKFVSGWADTLKEELEEVFSRNGRQFVKVLEYTDLEMQDAATLALQVKRLRPDVLYVDAQPSSFAALVKRLVEQDVQGTALLTHSIAHDALLQELYDPRLYKGPIYYSDRRSYSSEFSRKFERRYGRLPIRNADLGYYAVRLLLAASQKGGDILQALRKTASFDGMNISFDGNNVYRGLSQEIYYLDDGKPKRVG